MRFGLSESCCAMARDRDDNPVFLAKSAWEIGYIADRYSKVRFAATRER